jgi:diketogulonate reductase-like aldo/keto reductase
MARATIPTVKLSNGIEMPVLGFGVFQIPLDQTEQAVADSLAAGYRSLDTAASYLNEEAVGRAIKASDIPRDELFVTTKLWIQDQGEEKAKRAFETSPGRLGLDYVDLYRNNLFSDPTLSEIGAVHGKSIAQVVLRWLIQRDVVVVQKSVRQERMRDDQMTRVATLDRDESLFFDHRDPALVSQLGNRRLD